MATQFGLTAQGFVTKQQQTIIEEINASLQQTFGANINLGAESVFGQIVGIFSEREALLWQLADAVYASQYPAGAEGTSVDNILALNNLKRLPAKATATNPAALTQGNGITLYGLVLFGTPGTTISATSIIQTTASPPLSFTLNAAVTIGVAINAVQSVFFGNVPTLGAFQLALQDPEGDTLTTSSIPFNALANQSLLNIGTTPAGASHFGLALSQAGVVETTANISTPGAFPTSGAIQTAITALSGYSGVTVSGSAGSYTISWGAIANPILSVVNNTTTATITPTGSVQAALNNLLDNSSFLLTGNTAISSTVITGMASTVGIVTGMLVTGAGIAANTYVTAVTSSTVALSVAATATASVVALTFANFYPYTDIQVSGSFAGGAFVITFGSGTIANFNPVSSFQPQALMSVALNSLEMVTTVTNINIVTTAIGAPAQGIGVATCTATGPNFVKAGTLTVIGSPVSGWTGVTNQLDCITGSNVETDTAALIRRSTLLAAQANGPIQAIVEKVSEVTGVAASIGFQNLTGAAQQLINFSSVPVSGTWQLSIAGFTTSDLAFNATAAQVQTAVQALSGFGLALVSGTVQYGFAINFNGAYGGQAQPLAAILNNSTGVTITPSFGRPPHSFEIVVEGGQSLDIATSIYGSMPAGIQAYSAPTLQTTSTASAGSSTLLVASTAGIVVGNAIYAQGIPPGTTVVSIGVGSVVMSLPALVSTVSVSTIFNNTVTIFDTNNTPNYIGFSRPVQIPIYVTIVLITDIFNTPGVPASGANPNSKFNPQSIATIQNDIVTIGGDVSIGGLVIGFGTNGLIGAFNDVPGIVSYTLFFGTSPAPVANVNIQMQPEQQALFESFNIVASYS